ncbi:MAG: diguanylate cyclase [Lachnospiraceae bacterium]|nr:diguanylate cyclase [Lachnospiraceae bacterium]
MKQKYKKTAWAAIVMLACAVIGAGLFWSLHTSTYAAGSANAGRILFISSYSYAWDAVQLQIEGIQKGVSDGIVVDYEFMDTKRVDDDVAMYLFKEGLAYRMSMVEPYDVVILGDDAALVFALEYRDELFAGIPLVFEGVNDEELALEASKDPMITGVIESLSVQKNIELALSIYPEAKKVVGILDDTLTGEAERRNFYNNASLYPNLEFSELNTSELTETKLKFELSHLPEDTILIYVVMTEDANGRQYTNKEAIELIAQYSTVPAFRMVEGGIGYGVLGGNIVSMEQSGKIAAEIAVDIINGKKDMEEVNVIVDSPNIYCIDESVMRKFGIKASALPDETVFVNHEPNFFERNREILVPTIIAVVALFIICAWASVDNIKKRVLTAELKESRSYLEDASNHDFLTGLPNRSKFMHDLMEAAAAKQPYTIIMLDIDNFKHINDTYGHSIGDEALKGVASRLKALRTQLLTAYRFAGDEFIVILKSDNVKIVDTAANQCLQVFQKPFKLEGKIHNIGGSVGAASYPGDADDYEKVIECADEAMYSVKQSGKNAYAIYKNIKQ